MRYHIVGQMFPQGCVVDGASVGANTPLYYLQESNNNDESLWIITEESALLGLPDTYGIYSIKNAKTGKYVVYDGVRQDSPELRRYVSMRDDLGSTEDDDYLIRAIWFIYQPH